MKTTKKANQPTDVREPKLKDFYNAEYNALMSRQNIYITLIYTSQFLILTYLSFIFTLIDKKAFSYTEEMASSLFLGYNIIFYVGITVRHKYFKIRYYIKNFLLNDEKAKVNFFTYKFFEYPTRKSFKNFFRIMEEAFSSVLYSYYLIAISFYPIIFFYALFQQKSVSPFYFVNLFITGLILITISKIYKLTDDIRFL